MFLLIYIVQNHITFDLKYLLISNITFDCFFLSAWVKKSE